MPREPSVGFDYEAIEEAERAELRPETAVIKEANGDVLEFARRLTRYVRSKERCRLTLDCLYLALGDAELEDATMTSVALDHGVTKAAISKRVGEIRRDLHLPVTANNKSADACKKYQSSNSSPFRLDKSS